MAKKSDILSSQNSGFFQDMLLRIRLILRLMGDRRVNIFLKLIPLAAIAYVISPVDLIPGAVLPVIGTLDDAAVLWLGVSLFTSLCPDEVVQEHMNSLHKVVNGAWRDAPPGEEGEITERSIQDSPKNE